MTVAPHASAPPLVHGSRNKRHSLPATVLLRLALMVALGLALAGVLPHDAAVHLAPTMASIIVFVLFWLVLQRHLGENIFGELGFIYVGLIVAFTVVPALAFMTVSFYQGGPLDQLLPESSELQTHLWRHVLFQTGVASGYLLFRGRSTWQRPSDWEGQDRDGRTLGFIAILIAVSVSSVILFSAPVESYYDHYIRYAHLPWLQRKFVSLFVRMSLGLYCVLLVFLFRNYEKYKKIIPVVVVAICAHEIAYSMGARIQALLVLLQALLLYHYTVRKISLKWGLIGCAGLVTVFSAVELVRFLDFDLSSARSRVADEGLKPASEFISVFFPGFHLYAERAAGSLPAREWQMLFSDFISLFTFGDFARWNPMDWYARNYYPHADVPPFTLGPIADSAIWGGEIDLLLRSLINGAFFAYITRWFVRYGHRWWGLVVYIYCCATCILTLKYSVFLHLHLIAKNLLPVLLLVHAARVLRLSSRGRSSDDPIVAEMSLASDSGPAAIQR